MEKKSYILVGGDKWEEIEDEDLWEDGELKIDEVFDKINYYLFVKGNWKLIRRIHE